MSRVGQTCQRTSPGHYCPREAPSPGHPAHSHRTVPPAVVISPLPQGWQDCAQAGAARAGDGQSALTCQGSQQKSICLS